MLNKMKVEIPAVSGELEFVKIRDLLKRDTGKTTGRHLKKLGFAMPEAELLSRWLWGESDKYPDEADELVFVGEDRVWLLEIAGHRDPERFDQPLRDSIILGEEDDGTYVVRFCGSK